MKRDIQLRVGQNISALGHSRANYIEFTRRCDIHSFLRCFTHELEHFDGVPKVALTDRMKTVVLGRNDDRSPVWHPAFQDFALSVGLTPKLCRVRRPQTKGKVERAVRFVKENFWVAPQFTNLADLNRQALAWCQIPPRGGHPCSWLTVGMSPTPVWDFHPKDSAHAGRTNKRERMIMSSLLIEGSIRKLIPIQLVFSYKCRFIFAFCPICYLNRQT
ncbi:hypothetical protein [Alicyclobacillus dauci]|uniref:Integrase catalytic domain-containing protein n=1 Tax=Alicyclobacillus dauci TaxID=1475485 RepID=A0ABY6Z3T6_9BACL|nr:hypothetical protein [Alicyclobacillus dauci]WAH37502.1 hypothetical protein NZD86_02905 [Alicyclobacillus dauci]